MKNKKVVFGLVGFFIVLSAVFMTYFYKVTRVDVKPLPVYGEQGHRTHPFSFTDQEGRPFTSEDAEGKILVVEYFFATCKGICPKMNENLNKVYQQFKGNKEILFLSHTVDPEEDSAAALKQYSLQFEADPAQWKFLTGDKKELYDKARYSYLISAQDDTAGVSIDKDFIHDNHFVLVDRHGHIRGMYDGLDFVEVSKLINDLKSLLQIAD
jgi:protein SCO1